MKWKLTHKHQKAWIENTGGKTLSYNPNLGIQIIEEEGFAFKDLDHNGKLDPFEDWRLSLTERVQDFTSRFVLWQEEDGLYYQKGKINLSKEYQEFLQSNSIESILENAIHSGKEDIEYLKKNYIVTVLLLMLDNDFDTGNAYDLLQVIIQSMDLGVLENILYSIMEAIKKYVKKYSSNPQLQEAYI